MTEAYRVQPTQDEYLLQFWTKTADTQSTCSTHNTRISLQMAAIFHTAQQMVIRRKGMTYVTSFCLKDSTARYITWLMASNAHWCEASGTATYIMFIHCEQQDVQCSMQAYHSPVICTRSFSVFAHIRQTSTHFRPCWEAEIKLARPEHTVGK